MDEFLEPYWNLDQVRSWAETRNADAVRFAAIPKEGKPKTGREIATFCCKAATEAKERDVPAELWAASGWTQPAQIVLPPPVAQEVADEIGFPISLGLFNKDVQINLPKRAHADALLALWAEAPDQERALITELMEVDPRRGKALDWTRDYRNCLPNCAPSQLTTFPHRSRMGRPTCSSGVLFRRSVTLNIFFAPALCVQSRIAPANRTRVNCPRRTGRDSRSRRAASCRGSASGESERLSSEGKVKWREDCQKRVPGVQSNKGNGAH